MCGRRADLDLDDLSDGVLLEHLREMLAVVNRLTAHAARVTRRADVRSACEYDGATTMQSWLRGHLRVSGALAKDLVAMGRALEQLPATGAAFAAGEVGADQVEVIAQIVKPAHLELAAAQGIDIGAVEAALVELACRGTHRDLQRAVGEYLAKLDPDGPEPDPTEERAVTLAQHPDGSWTIGGTLDAVGGQRVATALESISTAGRCAGDTRSRTPPPARLRPVPAWARPSPPRALGGWPVTPASPAWCSTPTGYRWTSAGSSGSCRRTSAKPSRPATSSACSPAAKPPRWFCDRKDPCAPHPSQAQGGTLRRGRPAEGERHHTEVHHGFRVERDDTAPPGSRWRTYRPDGTQILIHPPLRT